MEGDWEGEAGRGHRKPDVSRSAPPRVTGVALRDSGAAA